MPRNSESGSLHRSVNRLVSICSRADLKTWRHCAPNILNNVKADIYTLIVPDQEVFIFKLSTPEGFEVIPESRLSSPFFSKLKSAMPEGKEDRFGWYFQQFLKIAALADCRDDDILVIWDADTLPLSEINFVSPKGEIIFYRGDEEHNAYFSCIRNLLGLDKIVSYSFIAQCFPVRGRWVKAFIAEIEGHFQKPWYDVLIDHIDFSEDSGFSEYETLGTFISHRFPKEFRFSDRHWCRRGHSLMGDVENIYKPNAFFFLSKYDFISFEKWDKPTQNELILPLFVRPKFVRLLLSRLFHSRFRVKRPRVRDLSEFLKRFFERENNKYIVQVGANDGVQSDPLREFLKEEGKYSATLIEPLPFYAEKLRELYKCRADVSVENCAVGETEGSLVLYYIPPDVADQMNGDGPANNWAHGQGSFSREIVEYWIRENAFRGEEYRGKIGFFISKIESSVVPVKRVSEFQDRGDEVLLCIDAQGYELSVLKGVDWSSPPAYIIYEDDRDGNNDVSEFLKYKKYEYLCGGHDKVYAWTGR